MKTSLLFVSLLISGPAHAQFWRPVDDITSAVGKPTPQGAPVKSYSGPPPSAPQPYTPRQRPEPARYPVAIDTHPETAQKLATLCFEGIRTSFFDPYSARMDKYQLYRMPGGDPGVAVWLNARNRFGAYTGSKPYRCYKDGGDWQVSEGSW
jgi:hypothetical protein